MGMLWVHVMMCSLMIMCLCVETVDCLDFHCLLASSLEIRLYEVIFAEYTHLVNKGSMDKSWH